MTISQPVGSTPRVVPRPAAGTRGAQWRSIKLFITAMLFLSPSLLIFILFVFIPLLKTIQLSLYYTNPIGQMAGFAGLDNYQRIFSEPDLMNSLYVSIMFAVYMVPLTIIISLLLAVVANVEVRGISVFRVIFSSTIAVSGAVAALIFQFLYNPINGTFNYLLDIIRMPRVPWLTSDATALFSVAFVTVWLQLGFCTILFLAAIQGIPQELYESAKIDGAGFWSSFRHITVPMVSPTLFFLVVVQTLNALQAFTQINILTRGGPANSTNAMVYLIYRSFYFYNQYGIAGALSIVLFIVMLALTILQFGVLERRVHYT